MLFSCINNAKWMYMLRSVILLSSFLVMATPHALAQTNAQPDPFQRSAPTQNTPVLQTTQAPVAQAAPPSLPAQAPSFGSPRTSSDSSTTRVVFDLPTGVAYTLTPTFTGLRLDVRGARITPAVTARLGPSVTEYRATSTNVLLSTPFPLALSDGWRASEATLASGSRVLILEFSPTLSGGAGPTLKAGTLKVAGVAAPAPAPAVTAVAPVTASAKPQPLVPVAKQPTNLPVGLPPGDTLTSGQGLPAAPILPSAPDQNTPNVTAGRVPGSVQAGATLAQPRLGKNPGQTRVVLDLPPGTGYRIVPSGLSLRVELTGVTAAPQESTDVSPELRSWRYSQEGGTLVATLVTGTPMSMRRGWHVQLLPPLAGDRSRLVLDLSPAYADLTPLPAAQRQIAAVPPVPATRGTAMLALSASYVQPRVVIDPGHGGKDPGAVGIIVEKEVNLEIARRVQTLLRAAGVDAVLTRANDTFIPLEGRPAIASPGTQLFVSIHVNSTEPYAALRNYGIETWWNPNHPLSSNLAQVLQDNMVEMTGAVSRGLKNRTSLSVLRNSRVPAALVEVGFTSHPIEGQNLLDSNYLDRLAVGIARGIRQALVTGITASGSGTPVAAGGAGK